MILGIDLGQKTTGVAISEGHFASPYTTLKHQSPQQAVGKVVTLVEKLNVDKVIVGYVEGKIKSLFTEFATLLKKKKPELEVILMDETLTTGQARQYLLKLQVPKKKRAAQEHEVAAAIILQQFLDTQ